MNTTQDQGHSTGSSPLRLLLLGAGGRMGASIRELLSRDSRFTLVATPGSDDELGPDTPGFDVAIDFSRPEGLLKLVELCHSRARPLVTGTTGMDSHLQAKLVGAMVAKVCQEKGISKVVFDRNGYLYHGRIRGVAEGAREAGLDF